MSDFSRIWNDGPEEGTTLNEAQLLAYMEGKLTEEERRKIEEQISQESMESDALEGLSALNPEETKALKHRLNTGLQRSIKRRRRSKQTLWDQRWTWLALALILLFSILAYLVIFRAGKH